MSPTFWIRFIVLMLMFYGAFFAAAICLYKFKK